MENSKAQTKPDRKLSNINTPPPPQKKRYTFTYIGKQTTFITKIFKHTNIKTAYHTNNTIQETLTPKTQITKNFQLLEYTNERVQIVVKLTQVNHEELLQKMWLTLAHLQKQL